ncbi:MAG: Lsr2 family protein [Mycolicibacterium sp.]|uniref:histone-like nucleoid-structuring protein Lsr2 n=1 Tax=Mycolicibacterium sp. TaxID=2320850 RepID=UPI003D146F16
MARKTDSYLVDDLDSSKPAVTVQFGLHGADYEIDLAAHNAKELETFLDRFIRAGRRVGRGGRSSKRSVARHAHLQAARTWLRENGYEIGDRGRIPKPWLEKFEAAQAGTQG